MMSVAVCKHVNFKTFLRFSLISAVWCMITIIYYIDLNVLSLSSSSTIVNNPNTAPAKGQRIQKRNICPPQFIKEAPEIISNETLTHFCGPNAYNCTEKYEEGIAFNERYKVTTNERRKNLESMISPSMSDKENDAVILMSVNYGFSWLFANWACSLEHNLNQAQIENIKKRTIVVVTDKKAQKAVNEMGFMTHYPDWLGDDLLSIITEDGAHSFGIGSHIEINALTIAILNDLVHLNFNVLMQDVDVVWNKEPINYLMNEVDADLAMSSDGRSDEKGPGNSGFLFIRSTCMTKVFTQTLWNARSQIDGSSDQMFWATLIDDRIFRQLHFKVLDESLFANGHTILLKRGGTLIPQHFIFHASWCEDVFDKIEKFWNTQHFYYQSHLCAYYDENMVADIANRKKKFQKTKQEMKFLKLGLFKNGTRQS